MHMSHIQQNVALIPLTQLGYNIIVLNCWIVGHFHFSCGPLLVKWAIKVQTLRVAFIICFDFAKWMFKLRAISIWGSGSSEPVSRSANGGKILCTKEVIGFESISLLRSITSQILLLALSSITDPILLFFTKDNAIFMVDRIWRLLTVYHYPKFSGRFHQGQLICRMLSHRSSETVCDAVVSSGSWCYK